MYRIKYREKEGSMARNNESEVQIHLQEQHIRDSNKIWVITRLITGHEYRVSREIKHMEYQMNFI
jgi:hypothetical protein